MKWWRRVRRSFGPNPDRFLRAARGVVHVGANVGQERDLYARHELDVLWVEPIPDVFATLVHNIEGYARQRALRALVTNRDGVDYQFHIANNAGESSSILELKEHRDVWPKVAYSRTITLASVTLATLFAREAIDPAAYDALVLDTQGSELLVLEGAAPLLPHFRFIKSEVPDFEAYEGCAQLPELSAFLRDRHYVEWARRAFAQSQAGGRYYDILYRRESLV